MRQVSPIVREVPVRRVRTRRSYPFKHMKPGWSFRVVPDWDEDIADIDRLVRSAVKSFQKNFPEDRIPRFEVYVSWANGVQGVRCTRLDSEGPSDPIADFPKFKANWKPSRLPYGRVAPGECFDVRMVDTCPTRIGLMKVRENIKHFYPHSVFRLEAIKLPGKPEVIRVYRYV